ncbi:hypothetical protein HYPBUDRAFT_154279 [Hyphopichia burtonii NRRL Y-1933]|uniref:Ribosomal RNA-processing protein 17 n=1 Tax=Hyphopichia burtonii NRRL Y-1933 TaxID=984485 RepID=A0A1E4RBM9_9ASCO|nr:hypothetical protein HYPBUDRAFT_154279 [Hyphopichia burtonii NRRL Y-1933]ODV64659.1 hypothetical protein HYPBUDRAFT_154279 [Hyphopichia burtonii NRRL Y-1933]
MSSIRRNREILTGGKKYHQQQTKKFGVDEVVFDKESRQEYLTGFHKRKLQRQKKAQEYIKEQERLAKVQERKEIRDERKKDLENQLKGFKDTMERITHLDSSDEEEDKWDGFDSKSNSSSEDEAEDGEEDGEEDDDGEKEKKEKRRPQKGILHHTEIYKRDDSNDFPQGDAIIDDETTVTVESLDNPHIKKIQDTNLEAIALANNVRLKDSEDVLKDSIDKAKKYAVTCGVAKPSLKDKIKKKKKFRYLTKAERRDNNRKIKANKLKSSKRDKS